MVIFSAKINVFSLKIEKFAHKLTSRNYWSVQKKSKMLKNVFNLHFLCLKEVSVTFIQILLTIFSIFREKTLIFAENMTIFQILIKWPKMIVSGCYIAQIDRNLHSVPEINVRSRYIMRKIVNLREKSSGVQKWAKIIFVIFGFLSFLVKLKVVSF